MNRGAYRAYTRLRAAREAAGTARKQLPGLPGRLRSALRPRTGPTAPGDG